MDPITLPYVMAFFIASGDDDPAFAICPITAPAKESPAPVGSTGFEMGNPGLAKTVQNS